MCELFMGSSHLSAHCPVDEAALCAKLSNRSCVTSVTFQNVLLEFFFIVLPEYFFFETN